MLVEDDICSDRDTKRLLTPINKFKCPTIPTFVAPSCTLYWTQTWARSSLQAIVVYWPKDFLDLHHMWDVGLSFNSKNKCEQMFWISLYFVEAKLRQKCYAHYGVTVVYYMILFNNTRSYLTWDAFSTTVQHGNWLKTYPKKTPLYHFHAEKALFEGPTAI